MPAAVGLSRTGSTTAQTGAGTAAIARAVPPLQPALCPHKLPWVLQQVLLVPVPPRGFSWAAPSGWQGECIPRHASCTSTAQHPDTEQPSGLTKVSQHPGGPDQVSVLAAVLCTHHPKAESIPQPTVNFTSFREKITASCGAVTIKPSPDISRSILHSQA